MNMVVKTITFVKGSFNLIQQLTYYRCYPKKYWEDIKLSPFPQRRENQSYVIATSIKVDIAAVSMEKFDDKYFSKQVEKKKKKGEGEFFEAEKEEKSQLPQEKKDNQKTLIKSIEAVPDLKSYLGARFSLKAGMKPHELVFRFNAVEYIYQY